MELAVLGTGSSGNCYVLHDQDEALLLDAGLSVNTILRGIGFRARYVTACLITHEHADHCRGAGKLAQLGIPILGTEGTKRALPYLQALPPFKQHKLGRFTVMPFPVVHDTPEPCGWLVLNTRTGERLLYATDTGTLRYTFPGIHYWLIECNHVEALLDMTDPPQGAAHGCLCRLPSGQDLYRCNRPPQVCRPQVERIHRYHMGLEMLAQVLGRNDLTECRQIVLCHMSRERGDAKRMVERISETTHKPVVMAAADACIPLEKEPF